MDASESNLRALFADQLGGSRVERVDFHSSVPAAPARKRSKDSSAEKARIREDEEGAVKGRKRKRDEEVVAEGMVEDEESALPRIWSSELRRGGSSAVVVFVDGRSCKGAMKEVKRVVEEGASVWWRGGEGLGIEREFLFASLRSIRSGFARGPVPG